MIRVLVVEDEPVAAEAHRAYVDRTPGFTTVGVAANAARALDVLARTQTDLVLLDMNLPDTHGIELCRRVRAAGVDVDILVAYAEYRGRLRSQGDAEGQEDVDRALAAARPQRPAALPKGMHRQTLDAVVAALRSAHGLSAAETAEHIGASRITARRYLEYLADAGLAARAPRYGGAGRPETEYRWR